jgi:hypothetical protein
LFNTGDFITGDFSLDKVKVTSSVKQCCGSSRAGPKQLGPTEPAMLKGSGNSVLPKPDPKPAYYEAHSLNESSKQCSSEQPPGAAGGEASGPQM